VVTDHLVWIDCEMTGLDLGHDALIEVAALVTDPDLKVLGEGVDVVIHADEALLEGMVDVSSVKELVRRWYPRIYYAKPEKGLAHRALADIKESIGELDYYRRVAFVPQPGPTSDQAKAAAAEVQELHQR